MTVPKAVSKLEDVGTVFYEDDTRDVTQYTADDLTRILNRPTLVKAKVIVARINRKLSRDDRQLRVCRPGTACSDQTGRYYVVNLALNALIETHVDLPALATRLGVLRDDEQITDG